MRQRALIPATAALIAGLLLGRAWPIPLAVSLPLLLAGAIAFFFAALRNRPAGQAPALCLALLAAGCLRITALLNPTLPENHLGHWPTDMRLEIEGVVREAPIRQVDGRGSFTLSATKVYTDAEHWTRAAGKARIYISRRMPSLIPWETVRLAVRLKYVADAGTPGIYRRAWAKITEGIYLEGRLTNGEKIARLDGTTTDPASLIEKVRRRIRDAGDQAGGEISWIVRALVLGDISRLDAHVDESFRRTGVSHILSLSGLHITAVAGLLYLLIWWGFSRSPRLARRLTIHRWAAWAAAPPAIIYTLLAGGQVAMLRSCIMFLTMLLSIYLGRRRDPVVGLAAAAILVLLFYPGALWQAGFQFSFAAVWGMIHWRGLAAKAAGARTPAEALAEHPLMDKMRTGLIQGFVLSAAAMLITTPISLWHFGATSPAALIANLFVIPIFSFLVVPPLLLGGIVALASPAAAAMIWKVSSFGVEQAFGGTLLLEKLGADYWRLGRPTLPEIALFLALFYAAPYYSRKRIRRISAVGLILLMLLPVGSRLLARQRDDPSLTMLDVGEGMAVLIEAPGGKRLLIDGGYDEKGMLTKAFLLARRILTLDVLVITHPDPDHYLGVIPIVEDFKIGEIWITRTTPGFLTPPAYRRLLERAREKGIPIKILTQAEAPFSRFGISFEILGPPSDAPQDWNANNQSLVLRLKRNERTVLITGDIEQAAEEAVIGTIPDFSAELVQAPHHGSQTSSSTAFIKGIGAKTVVIPVGFQNSFKHPRPEVLARWQESSAAILRTDMDGTITCRARQDGWQCSTYGKRSANPLLRTIFIK